jgi:hypothetical protein
MTQTRETTKVSDLPPNWSDYQIEFSSKDCCQLPINPVKYGAIYDSISGISKVNDECYIIKTHAGYVMIKSGKEKIPVRWGLPDNLDDFVLTGRERAETVRGKSIE